MMLQRNLQCLSQRQRPFTTLCPHGRRTPPRTSHVVHGDIAKNLFGQDWGARDPTVGEIETGFGEKIMCNASTEHIIKPPDAMYNVIGLNARNCKPVEELQRLGQEDIVRLRNQVPGWRFNDSSSPTALEQSWKVKDAEAAGKLEEMVQQLAGQQGHPATVNKEGESVTVVVTTAALGGLTENDFVLANKINSLSLAELLPKRKQRFWA